MRPRMNGLTISSDPATTTATRPAPSATATTLATPTATSAMPTVTSGHVAQRCRTRDPLYA
jgi:hypothetical protein